MTSTALNKIRTRYQALVNQPLTQEGLLPWLSAWSDLLKETGEVRARLMLERDRDTCDEAAAGRYLDFRAEVEELEPLEQRLRTKLLKSGLNAPEGAELAVRRLKTDATLYCEANAGLETEVERLLGEVGRVHAGLRLSLNGDTLTLHDAFTKQFVPEREVRERAFLGVEQAKASVAEEVDDISLQLLNVRQQMADNVGADTYRAFDWQRSHRFDYTPADALSLHDTIASEVVPLLAELYEQKAAQLGVGTLRPWDLLVDPDTAPLQPFATATDLRVGVQRLFNAIDPAFGKEFAAMHPDWLDLESREGKLPMVGYCLPFPRSERAFIYHSFFGAHADVWILLHEGAHAFHMTAAAQGQDLIWNRDPGGEFLELVSQAMELLGLAHMGQSADGFYTEAEARQAEREQLTRCLRLIATAQTDAFHHWLYSHTGDLSAAELDEKWLELERRYNPWTDWSGLERFARKGWHSRSVLAKPFDNLPYKLAMFGALEVWRRSLSETEETLRAYRAALSVGGSRSLPELYEMVGATLLPTRGQVRDLAQWLVRRLQP